MLAGSGGTPANTGDIDYILGVGAGGDASNGRPDSNGGNGYAVLSYTQDAGPAATPEPGSIALLLSGGLVVAGALKRWRALRKS
jgi:hypothetical protein